MFQLLSSWGENILGFSEIRYLIAGILLALVIASGVQRLFGLVTRRHPHIVADNVQAMISQARQFKVLASQDGSQPISLMHISNALTLIDIAMRFMSENEIFKLSGINVADMVSSLTSDRETILYRLGLANGGTNNNVGVGNVLPAEGPTAPRS